MLISYLDNWNSFSSSQYPFILPSYPQSILHLVLRMNFSKHNFVHGNLCSSTFHCFENEDKILELTCETSWSGLFSFLPLQPHPGYSSLTLHPSASWVLFHSLQAHFPFLPQGICISYSICLEYHLSDLSVRSSYYFSLNSLFYVFGASLQFVFCLWNDLVAFLPCWVLSSIKAGILSGFARCCITNT